MIEQKEEKKRLFYKIVLLLTLITMIIGATFALLSLIASQREEGTVLYTGTLQINYIDGTYIKDPELYPMKNVDYNTYENVYRNSFSVNSTGTLDQTIRVDLEVTKNEFSENALKYIVFNDKGTEMASGYVPQSGNVTLANNMYLKEGGTAKYTIIIWWDNTGYNQMSESGHVISGKITAYAKQIKH